MKINKLTGYLAVSTLLAACVSSTNKTFKPLPENLIPEQIEHKVDSLSKETKEIMNDTTYHFYGRDTLKLNKNFADKTEKFLKEINKQAKSNDKQVIVDKYTALEPLYPWKPASPMRVPKTKYVYAGEHINHKAVIKDSKIFTTDSTDMYIPVEYYGQINPKVSK